ncbi:MAG: phosphoglucosamine mutase [candidate division WOR-3 bacterium]
MSKPIFTVSGLRGIVGQDLLPELVTNYAFSFGSFLKAKKIAIGRDTRLSGPILFHAAVAGLFSAGCSVYDFDICPTPAIIMMVKKLNLDGGIQITASHNPKEYNGLKFISHQGTLLFEEQIEQFKKYIDHKKDNLFTTINSSASLYRRNILDAYLQQIVSSKYFRNIPKRNFRVGIDSCNGAAEEFAIKLVKMLGATPISIKKDQTIFPRKPEPTPGNLRRLSSAIRRQKLDFGIAFDPDADRFACVDEQGIPLSEEASVLLAIQFILEQKKGPVVVNNSTTMAVEDICSKFGVPVYRSKVGEANVIKKMLEIKAVVGGEGNGGVIIPEINLARDGLVATALLLKLLSKRNCPLSVIRKELPQYFIEKKIVYKFYSNWESRIRKHFRDEPRFKFDTQDGLKVIGEKFWILIRKSRTEPVLRIIAESNSKILTKKLITEVTENITY